MSVLVTGGAGYIGSHMVLGLLDRGEQVVVLDNLVTGVRGLVAEGAHFVEGDIRDARLVRDLIERHAIDAVIHFAALIEARPYRPAMPRADAYKILCGMDGKLERSLVKAFRNVALVA